MVSKSSFLDGLFDDAIRGLVFEYEGEQWTESQLIDLFNKIKERAPDLITRDHNSVWLGPDIMGFWFGNLG